MSIPPQDPSRRAFVIAGAAALLSASTARARGADVTAQQVVDRIRANVGLPWRETTIDTFKAGDPRTIVTGIATTVMATLPVLRQAVSTGCNLIVTCEPTFYAGNDEAGARANDPVYLAKKAFIADHNLVVWRFSDHWGARVPSEFAKALADTLGWGKLKAGDAAPIYSIPSTTLGSLAAHVRTTLGVRGGMRIIGKSAMPIRRVLLSPGTTDLQTTISYLPQADAILCGEPREWEAVEYVFDTASAGQTKGMISVGRIVSEEPGVRACAAWLRALIPEVQVEGIAVGDPYWRPTL
jgi:hypothetical protein